MDIEILSEKFCEYAQYILGRSPCTIKGYRLAVRLYRETVAVHNIEQVTDSNVKQFFIQGRTIRKWKSSSFIYYHKTLIVFFRWCVKQGYLSHNPVDDIETPRLEKRLPKKLTRQEAEQILEAVQNYPYDYPFLRYRNHAIFATYIYTGLRKNELLNLKMTDVDIENLTIFVHQGKGSKDRIIPMSYTLALILKRYLTDRKKLRKTCPEFFVSLNLNVGYTQSGLRRLLEKIIRASGIKFTIHQLRHTFATLMLEGGCDIYSLSRMMGHADIKTTTIYLAATAEHLRGQMGKHPLNN